MAENVAGNTHDDCFVDRQDVLEGLEVLADCVEREQRPRYAFIYGESGIGKTAIIRHFLGLQNSKRLDGCLAISVECEEIKAQPLLPFIMGMRKFRGSQSITRMAARLALNFIGNMPVVGPYVKGAEDAFMEYRMSDADRLMTGETEIFLRYSDAVRAASEHKMLIFCVDDAQWLDETGMRLLSHIIHENTDTGILFVIAARGPGGGQNKALRHLDAIMRRVEVRSARMEVGPFKMDACAEMIRRFSGDGVRDQHIRDVYNATNGNPWRLRHALLSGTTDAPPAGLQRPDWLLDDVYSAVPESKRVLWYAAVLGFRFDLHTLAGVLGMETTRVFGVLTDVGKHGIVKNPENGKYFEFAHQMVRDSIYESIKPIQATCHEDAAKFLEEEDPNAQNHYLMAYHYLKTPRKDLALRHMRLAASASMSGNLFTDASERLGQCLKIAERLDLGDEEIYAIRVDYARSLLEENRVESSRKMLEWLVNSRHLTPERAAQVHTLLSRCHRLTGTAESGAKALSHARTAAEMMDGGDAKHAGDAYAYLATVCDHFGDDDSETRRAFRKATKYYQNYPMELAMLHRKSGMVLESRQAIRIMESALQGFDRYKMKIETARCMNNIGAECLYIGRFGESYEWLSRSLETFRMVGSHEVDIPLNNLGLFHLQKGDYELAMERFECALARQSEPYNEIAITVNISTVHRKKGQPRQAVEILTKVEEMVMENAEPTLRDYYGFNRGAAHRDLGELDAAEEWLLKFQANTYKNDHRLAWAKRMRALSEICDMREGTPRISSSDEAEIQKIFVTQRPQRWFYEADYYPCDIHIWD